MSDIVHRNVPVSDGWSDAAAEAGERLLRGTLLKFSDWHFYAGKEATPIDKGRQLIAVDTTAAWVKWANGKPCEHRIRRPGEQLPEREELGDLDEEFWELAANGERRDPWQSTRFVTFVCPHTAEMFTFSTSSWGGRSAVIELADAIARMRTAYPDAVPVVELKAAAMPTKHGKKSKAPLPGGRLEVCRRGPARRAHHHAAVAGRGNRRRDSVLGTQRCRPGGSPDDSLSVNRKGHDDEQTQANHHQRRRQRWHPAHR
jgi:hypothetical protein